MNQVSEQSPTIKGGEFLTFRLGDDEYGIDILRVQEIRSYEEPTQMAVVPAFIKGVVNLRGIMVPIVDLRLRFKCANAEINAFTAVIVLNVHGHVVGIVVDSVSDVIELSAWQIRPAPGLDVNIGYISGLCTTKVGEGKGSVPQEIILLDIDTFLGDPGLGHFPTRLP